MRFENRSALWREMWEICRRGWYDSAGGRRVEIGATLRRAVEGTALYRPSDFSRVERLAAARVDARCGSVAGPTRFIVANRSTLAAARDLAALSEPTAADSMAIGSTASGSIDSDPRPGVLCLNFASAKNPGSGFVGVEAQEESLTRSSGLSACIAPQREMYDANRACGTCLYTDHMLWSPGVPVFRDDDGELLDVPYEVAFLTAPAVNAGAVKGDDRGRIAAMMRSRVGKVLAVAAERGHTRLVLGAWGCGVLRNDPSQVAGWFLEWLTDGGAYAAAFETVVFAVLDTSPERRFLGPFEERFGAL